MFRDGRHSPSSPNKLFIKGEEYGKNIVIRVRRVTLFNTNGWVIQQYIQPISLWLTLYQRCKTNKFDSLFETRSNHDVNYCQSDLIGFLIALWEVIVSDDGINHSSTF